MFGGKTQPVEKLISHPLGRLGIYSWADVTSLLSPNTYHTARERVCWTITFSGVGEWACAAMEAELTWPIDSDTEAIHFTPELWDAALEFYEHVIRTGML